MLKWNKKTKNEILKTHKIPKPTIACNDAIGFPLFIFNAILY
jgi:hypothetical protein